MDHFNSSVPRPSRRVASFSLARFLLLALSFSPPFERIRETSTQLKSASATPPRYRAGFYIRRHLMISRELESRTQTAGAIHVHYNLEGEVSPLKELRTRSSQVDGNWLIFKEESQGNRSRPNSSEKKEEVCNCVRRPRSIFSWLVKGESIKDKTCILEDNDSEYNLIRKYVPGTSHLVTSCD